MLKKNKLKKFFCLILVILNLMLIPVLAKDAPKAKTKINPQAFHLCELAVNIASEGEYDTAIIYLKRALELEPKFETALFNLGSIYRIQKKYEDSYAIFQELLLKNPADHEARLEKTLTLIAMKSYNDALSELKKVPASQKRYSEVQEKLQKVLANSTPPKNIIESAKQPKGLYKYEKLSLSFNTPTGITSDLENNIYIANFSGNAIEKISAKNNKRQVFAEGNLISGPSDLVFDDNTGELLVANYKSGNIVKINQLGQMHVLIDNLEKPYSLFLKKDGQLYISEQGKKAVSIINLH